MNVGLLVTRAARVAPDRLAIAYGKDELTYRQLDERVNRLANALRDLGIAKGDRVSIVQRNCPQYLETLFACFKAGACAVPINNRLHPKELAYIIGHSESKAVVYSEEFGEVIAGMRDELACVERYVCLSQPGPGALDYGTVIAGGDPREATVEVAPDDLGWMFYTSGTTGRPKGAMLTHRNLIAMTMNYFADVYPLEREDVMFHAAPLSHGSGLWSLVAFAKGATHAILRADRFDPEAVFQTIQERRCTCAFLVPTQVNILLNSPALPRYDLSSLKCLSYGGSPMYLEDLKRALQVFGPVLVQVYGQGESPMTISYLRKEDHVVGGTPDQEKRLLSAGIARSDVEVRVVDDQDRDVPPGTMGEIIVRGDVVMPGYWRNPEATAESLRGGWLHTGDVGTMDENGYIYLMDRMKDLIISGGSNIYPREIEEVLLKHPAVYEAAVFGVPDPKWGESVKAVVSLRPGMRATESELITLCEENLASYKKPRTVDFVDALPKSGIGKILKRELRDKYWVGQVRRI